MTIVFSAPPTSVVFGYQPSQRRVCSTTTTTSIIIERQCLAAAVGLLQSARSLEQRFAPSVCPVRRSLDAQPIKAATPPWLFCPRDLLASACLAHNDEILLAMQMTRWHSRRMAVLNSPRCPAAIVRQTAVWTRDHDVRAPPFTTVLGCSQRCARECQVRHASANRYNFGILYPLYHSAVCLK
jgi:hypothetical protein